MLVDTEVKFIDSQCDDLVINTEKCISLDEVQNLIDSSEKFSIDRIFIDMRATNLGLVELVNDDTVDVFNNTRSFLVDIEFLKKLSDAENMSVIIQVSKH